MCKKPIPELTEEDLPPMCCEPQELQEIAEESGWDIEASNKRQSEFMHKHQDEPNVDYED